MSFKPFYIHRYHQPGKLPNRHTRGFTAMVSPITEDNSKVRVQAALCSPKDQFCKRLGREQAARNSSMDIPKWQLPRVLAALKTTTGVESTESDFYYTLKYVV